MKQSIALIGMAMAIATAGSTSALAAKCDVVGFWTATITGTTTSVAAFQMTTDKKGVSPYPNPECNNETSKIATTSLTGKVWDTSITAKKCSVIITTTTTWNKKKGVTPCTQATGTITIPITSPPTVYPITVNVVTSAKRPPSRTLLNGFK
jgi:hypothetical protein